MRKYYPDTLKLQFIFKSWSYGIVFDVIKNVCKLFDDRMFNDLVIINLTFYSCIFSFAKYNFITIFYKYEDTDFPEVNNIHV